jgi:hypothetical protein
MKKSDQIRAAMRGEGKLKLPEIAEKAAVSTADVSSFLYGAIKRKEVAREGETKADYTFELDESYVSRRGQHPVPKALHKAGRKRAARAPKGDREKLRELVRKARQQQSAPHNDLPALVLESLVDAGDHLAAMVRACVDPEESPELKRALAQHDLAQRMYRAVPR